MLLKDVRKISNKLYAHKYVQGKSIIFISPIMGKNVYRNTSNAIYLPLQCIYEEIMNTLNISLGLFAYLDSSARAFSPMATNLVSAPPCGRSAILFLICLAMPEWIAPHMPRSELMAITKCLGCSGADSHSDFS